MAHALPHILWVAASNMGEGAVGLDYAAAGFVALVLALLLVVLPIDDHDKRYLVLIWIAKSIVTLLAIPIYEAHYLTLDARMYFAIGHLGASAIPPFAVGNGTSVVIWLIHWATRIIPAYFHLLEVLWSFAGLLAIYTFYRGWRWLVWWLDSRLLLWLGLFPSILFWSSILGKDPPVLLGIGLYFYGIAKWTATRQLGLLWVAVTGVVLAAAIRPWLAVILVVPLLVFPFLRHSGSVRRRLTELGVLGLAVALAAWVFLDRFGVAGIGDLIRVSNVLSHGWAHGGSAVQLTQFHHLASMLAFVPTGIFAALFMPLPGQVNNIFGFASGIIDVILLLLTVVAIGRTRLKTVQVPWVAWAILLVLVWASMYGFASSQNLGTAVRFRLQILPVLWPLLLVLASSRARRLGLTFPTSPSPSPIPGERVPGNAPQLESSLLGRG